MSALPSYRAPRWLRNPHLQSVLASSRLRRITGGRRARSIEADAFAHVLDCGDDVRLLGRFNAQSALPESRGLIVLFHGWEGSTASSYLLRTGALLLDAGFDVFRLNFRDHGDTHHLNRGIFHSCRIDEVVGAVAAIKQQWKPRFLGVAGYSLGGNFALRVALRSPAAGIALDHAVSICPILSPPHGLLAMEESPWFYQHYFMHKWSASLRRKRQLFPDQIPETLTSGSGVRDLTRRLIEHVGEFASLEDYLDGYSVAGDRLSGLQVPVSILTAVDDPIIPVNDFRELRLPDNARLDIAEHGGHCGFLLDAQLNGYAERYVTQRMLDAVQSSSTGRCSGDIAAVAG
ncbi:MAG: alpha/beta fold hydrolase [Lysobacteraceae bacterium]